MGEQYTVRRFFAELIVPLFTIFTLFSGMILGVLCERTSVNHTSIPAEARKLLEGE